MTKRRLEDFYSGFEGEPEVQFVLGDGIWVIRIWVGYFDRIMALAQPKTDVGWQGLALHYHLNSGWYDEQKWPIPNLKQTLDEWRLIPTAGLDEHSLSVHRLVAELLDRGCSEALTVFIDYS